MEVYSNEHEQEDALRRFFSNNGKALVVGVIVGIGALAGWQFWSNHQAVNARDVSQAYQQVTHAINPANPGSLSAAAKFADDTANSYGALASLDVTKGYVDAGQFERAADQLRSGLHDTDDANLQAVLRLRLARVQLQLKQADEALSTLDAIKSDGWAAIVADIRGDALLSKGDVKGARDAWSHGIASDASSALKEMMQMKMNNLSS
ncbi:YfgM family protein [Pantoea sp. 1.19]|uniref:YfgM family protein n=1 Tax=Pantoea sp. 1.19 TaxID=1925589 RepID=UPI000948E130|nr:YfgM family protein [Pantoea sp. 1.19]